MLQGVPLGLASGSIPFLLQQRLTYSQIGIFTLATYEATPTPRTQSSRSYPYALKLGWSAFVDSVYSPGAVFLLYIRCAHSLMPLQFSAVGRAGLSPCNSSLV